MFSEENTLEHIKRAFDDTKIWKNRILTMYNKLINGKISLEEIISNSEITEIEKGIIILANVYAAKNYSESKNIELAESIKKIKNGINTLTMLLALVLSNEKLGIKETVKVIDTLAKKLKSPVTNSEEWSLSEEYISSIFSYIIPQIRNQEDFWKTLLETVTDEDILFSVEKHIAAQSIEFIEILKNSIYEERVKLRDLYISLLYLLIEKYLTKCTLVESDYFKKAMALSEELMNFVESIFVKKTRKGKKDLKITIYYSYRGALQNLSKIQSEKHEMSYVRRKQYSILYNILLSDIFLGNSIESTLHKIERLFPNDDLMLTSLVYPLKEVLDETVKEIIQTPDSGSSRRSWLFESLNKLLELEINCYLSIGKKNKALDVFKKEILYFFFKYKQHYMYVKRDPFVMYIDQLKKYNTLLATHYNVFLPQINKMIAVAQRKNKNKVVKELKELRNEVLIKILRENLGSLPDNLFRGLVYETLNTDNCNLSLLREITLACYAKKGYESLYPKLFNKLKMCRKNHLDVMLIGMLENVEHIITMDYINDLIASELASESSDYDTAYMIYRVGYWADFIEALKHYTTYLIANNRFDKYQFLVMKSLELLPNCCDSASSDYYLTFFKTVIKPLQSKKYKNALRDVILYMRKTHSTYHIFNKETWKTMVENYLRKNDINNAIRVLEHVLLLDEVTYVLTTIDEDFFSFYKYKVLPHYYLQIWKAYNRIKDKLISIEKIEIKRKEGEVSKYTKALEASFLALDDCSGRAISIDFHNRLYEICKVLVLMSQKNKVSTQLQEEIIKEYFERFCDAKELKLVPSAVDVKDKQTMQIPKRLKSMLLHNLLFLVERKLYEALDRWLEKKEINDSCFDRFIETLEMYKAMIRSDVFTVFLSDCKDYVSVVKRLINDYIELTTLVTLDYKNAIVKKTLQDQESYYSLYDFFLMPFTQRFVDCIDDYCIFLEVEYRNALLEKSFQFDFFYLYPDDRLPFIWFSNLSKLLKYIEKNRYDDFLFLLLVNLISIGDKTLMRGYTERPIDKLFLMQMIALVLTKI